MDNKLSSIDGGSKISLLENLVSLENDVYEFTIMREMTKSEVFGEYTCFISNGIGDPLILWYTLKQSRYL